MAVTYRPSASYSRDRKASADSSTSWVLCDGTAVTSGIILLAANVRSRAPGQRPQMGESRGVHRLWMAGRRPHHLVLGEMVVDDRVDPVRVPGRRDATDRLAGVVADELRVRLVDLVRAGQGLED